jgi:ribosomal protein S18 acetylase RimI-like enzyme
MATAACQLAIASHTARGMYQLQDELTAVYAEVYADSLDESFFDPSRYWQRLERYGASSGFSLITGRLDGLLVGYALGHTLRAGSSWWRGFRGTAEPGLLEEDGARTFALTEIMVRAAWRRRGYAKSLHDALLNARPEERATLLVMPNNKPAITAYLSWGWYKLGELQPVADAPVCEAMMRELGKGLGA